MRRAAVALGALAALFLGPAALAQGDADLGIDVGTSEHPTVEVTVTAPTALVAADIPTEAFSVAEDGQPREVTAEQLPGDDLEVVLLIDTSGSMRAGDAMPATRAAAIDFVERMPEPVRIAVAEFNSATEMLTPLSTDHEQHVAAIADLEPGGSTSLYDAVDVALQTFSTGTEDLRRAVVLLSDGGDTSSEQSLDDTVQALQAADATLYAIELVTGGTDPEALTALAEAGDGEHVSADDPDGLAAVYEGVANRLVNQYQLRYESGAAGRTELRVAVEHEGVAAEATTFVEFPAEETPTPPPATGTVAPPPGWLASDEARAVGIAAVAGALLLLLLSTFVPHERRSQLASQGRGSRTNESGERPIPGVSELANRVTSLADRVLRRRGYTSSLNQGLERAGVNLRPGEWVVLVICGAVTAFALGALLAGPVLGIVLAIVAVVASRVLVTVLGERRRSAFADQLGDTLQLLAGTLRAGYGLMQAVDSVAKESPSPTSEEYRRVVVEARLGRSVDDALTAMAERVGSEDFEWVIQAIDIHREVGGDLAEVLDTVAGTIRERGQIRRQVKALSAEGRLSAWVLLALPFATGGFIALANPSYLTVLVTDPLGWAMLAVGTLLLAVGGVWLTKTVKVVF